MEMMMIRQMYIKQIMIKILLKKLPKKFNNKNLQLNNKWKDNKQWLIIQQQNKNQQQNLIKHKTPIRLMMIPLNKLDKILICQDKNKNLPRRTTPLDYFISLYTMKINKVWWLKNFVWNTVCFPKTRQLK